MAGSRTQRAASPPFRYDAVVFESGEIDEIVVSIGRRHLRRIRPTSLEGRRLLNDGRVRLWRGPGLSGEQAPVSRVLQELRQRVEEQQARHPRDPRWGEACRDRLASIEHWQERYCIDH